MCDKMEGSETGCGRGGGGWVGGWGPRYLAVKRERGSARIPRLLGEDRFQSVDPFDLEP